MSLLEVSNLTKSFGGLVAVLLIFRPRGLLDEETLFRLRAARRAVRGRRLVVVAGRR